MDEGGNTRGNSEDAQPVDHFEEDVAMIERVAHETVKRYPGQTVILWYGMRRAHSEGITLDEALHQFTRDEDDDGLLEAGDRLLVLFDVLVKERPARVAEITTLLGSILNGST